MNLPSMASVQKLAAPLLAALAVVAVFLVIKEYKRVPTSAPPPAAIEQPAPPVAVPPTPAPTAPPAKVEPPAPPVVATVPAHPKAAAKGKPKPKVAAKKARPAVCDPARQHWWSCV